MTHVVLIHAFPLDSRVWEPVMLRLLDAGVDVHAVDLPGLGEGPALPVGEPSLAPIAAYVRGFASRGSVVAGVSLGGYVVMELVRQLAAAGESDLLGGIALCDTKSTTDPDAARAAREAMAAAVEHDPAASGALLRANVLPGLLAAEPDPHVFRLVGEWLDAAPPSAVAWYQRAMAVRPDSRADLAAFTGPALVLWGDEDRLSPESEQLLTLAALGRPTSACIANAGHLVCLEQPAAVAEALLSWIGESVDEAP